MSDEPARIAISLDIEMCTNFPTWDRQWDLRKGAIDVSTKDYVRRAARHARERGATIHFFLVGKALEDDDVEYLEEAVALGHKIGNHTYQHVNVLAGTVAQVQHTFARWPWLAAGRGGSDDGGTGVPPVASAPQEQQAVILQLLREQIAMTSEAIRQRLGVEPAGLRTPGGFPNGLNGREDLQRLLLDLGFAYSSSKYAGVPGLSDVYRLNDNLLRGVSDAQAGAQPYVYPTGLVEVPMSPPSDIHAFRSAKIELPDFLLAIRVAIESCIAQGGVFDFLAHPSSLSARDPHLQVLDLILDQVEAAGDFARLVTLDEIAAVADRAEPE